MADSRRRPSTVPDPGIGDPIEIEAKKLVGGGRALAHHAGATWMIRGGLPGETLLASADRTRGRVVEARTIEIVGGHHPARLESPCPHAPTCGGCDWPHVEPSAGAGLKARVAAEAAARFPRIAARLLDAPVTSSPASYRLRARLHWDPESRRLGFYGPRSWRVSEITECRILSPGLANAAASIAGAIGGTCPRPVDIELLEGRDCVVAALAPARGGPGEIPETWIPARDETPSLAGLHRLDRRSRVLRGWGREHVVMDLTVELRVPIGAFFQGNRHLIAWLFDRIADLIGAGDEPVFDLHGGVGFLAAAARSAGRSDLTVVEVHPGAAAAARINLPEAEVVSSTAESFVESRRPFPRRAVVIVDPPRSGMTAKLRSGLVGWRPRMVVMLGCDPATWSRDAADLIGNGYEMTHIEVIDLFPSTHHVEILAVLESS